MPAHRMTMRKTREILRLRWGKKLSQREVGQSCNCSSSTVHDVVARAKLAGLGWPLPADLDDATLEERLYPKPPSAVTRPDPDFKHIHFELGRKGVTLACAHPAPCAIREPRRPRFSKRLSEFLSTQASSVPG